MTFYAIILTARQRSWGTGTSIPLLVTSAGQDMTLQNMTFHDMTFQDYLLSFD